MTGNEHDTALIRALACKRNTDPAARLAIPVVKEDGTLIGRLACVDLGHMDNPATVNCLTEWRAMFMGFFLTQFEATPERTASWLHNVVLPATDRLLFLIELESGEAVGNFGICNLKADTGELDNLIRGRKGGDARLIHYAELALLSWMFGHLGLTSASLHVFSNNRPTIRLHRSVGFAEQQSHSLRLQRSPGLLQYLVDSDSGEPVGFRYVEMRLDRDRFLHQHHWIRQAHAQYWS